METTYDCIVLGAGIAGLGAATTMKDAGLKVLVLEKENRPGGRMTTDRVQGFVIDRGVTLLSGQYTNMKALSRRFNLEKYVSKIVFRFGQVEYGKRRIMRGGRLDDVLLRNDLSWSARTALLRFALMVLRHRNQLQHGQSPNQCALDNESVNDYFERTGGMELLDRIFSPGMVGACAGYLDRSSKLVLMQIFRNLVMGGAWTLSQGLDLIPESMAKQLQIKFNSEVARVDIDKDFTTVHTKEGLSYQARTVIFAMPGHLVPPLCPILPSGLASTLGNTAFAPMVNAHIAFNREIPVNCLAMGEPSKNYIIELEHWRCKQLCPPGKSMATIFWWDNRHQHPSVMNDRQLTEESDKILQACMPQSCPHRDFTHIVRWKHAIPFFAPGRLTEMSTLRNEMRTWSHPLQFCGDYLDGISSESALQTGIDAGNNTIRYLYNNQYGIQKSKTTVH